MKQTAKIFIVLAAFALLSFAGCKSQPETKPDDTMIQNIESDETENMQIAAESGIENAAAEAENARQTAINNKADENYAPQFKEAEEIFKAAKTEKDEDEEASIRKFEEARAMYETLSNLALAAEMRAEIDEKDFAGYDSQSYTEGERLYRNALNRFGIDYNTALSSSEDCLSLYRKVITAGYTAWAQTAKAAASEAKTDCDSIKVSKSMSKEYNEAVQDFNTGNKAFSQNEFKKSFEAYSNSFKTFLKLYKIVSEKRMEAEAALARAREKQNISSELALEADKAAPLPEDAAGFETPEMELSSLDLIKSQTESEGEITETEEDSSSKAPEDGNKEETKPDVSTDNTQENSSGSDDGEETDENAESDSEKGEF